MSRYCGDKVVDAVLEVAAQWKESCLLAHQNYRVLLDDY